ncbi:secreted RxLR effector protein 161-like [Cornus florida]|uniref:secreted RxLR effector protein 161-like n=1 Tax=Cornus florida TaxID=4283 RepID=UPI0028965A5D|nr:secreted RxLR effector protein 161-like [Cornus florida]
MRRIPYALAVGSLMNAMVCTRPNICYSLGIVSRYQSNPGLDHWSAVKNILKYLRRTKSFMLVYGGDDLVLIRYTDSDLQSDPDARRSTSGYVFKLNRGAVSWKSVKQGYTTDSTMEAEYIAASEAAKEAVWLRNFLIELEVVEHIDRPMTLHYDNSAAIAQTKDPKFYKRTRNIQRKHNVVHDIVKRGDILMAKIASKHNLANPFTKALSIKMFDRHMENMGVRCDSNCL